MTFADVFLSCRVRVFLFVCACLGVPKGSGRVLLRAARARDTGLREAGAGGAVCEHRGARQGQAVGAAASWVDGALVCEWVPSYVPGAVRWPLPAAGLCCAVDCVRVRPLSAAVVLLGSLSYVPSTIVL